MLRDTGDPVLRIPGLWDPGSPEPRQTVRKAMQTIHIWDKIPGAYGEEPVLEYYPAENKTSRATVVIFPGGGYRRRAPHEGAGYAAYFNQIGMDAFVMEYRVAPYKFPLPLLDARRAVRYVRAHAAEYGVDPARIAVMGSSAGGNLACLASTCFMPLEGECDDAVDRTDPRPNATILCYPVVSLTDLSITHIGSVVNLCDSMERAPEIDPVPRVDKDTPTAFIWHTSDDNVVNVINSYRYAEALRRAQVRCEMHIFPEGPHGIGLAEKLPHVAQWAGLMKNWLVYLGWL